MKPKKRRRRCSFKNCTVKWDGCRTSHDDVTLTFDNPIATVHITLSHKAWARLMEEVATKTIRIHCIHVAKVRDEMAILNDLCRSAERLAFSCPEYTLTEKEIVP